MIKRSLSYLIILTTTLFGPSVLLAWDCTALDGLWVGQLGQFTNVQLAIASERKPETKRATIRYTDSKNMPKYRELSLAVCHQRMDNQLSIEFHTHKDGSEIYLTAILSPGRLLNVSRFFVSENRRIEKVSGILQLN